MAAADAKHAYEVIFGVDDPGQNCPGRALVIKYAGPYGGVTAQPRMSQPIAGPT
jgi:hypothetical protein